MTSPQSVPPVAPARLEGDATDHASQVADPATDARQSEALAPLAAQEPAAAVSGPLFSPKEHQPVQDGLTAADLAHRSGRAQLVYKVWHLLCGYDAGRAVANAFVDLR